MLESNFEIVLIGKNAFTPLVDRGAVSFGTFLGERAPNAAAHGVSQVWCVDLPTSPSEWFNLIKHPRIHRTLIRYEPSVVLPQTHNRLFASLFSEIISVGRPANSPGTQITTNWPQLWGEMAERDANGRSERVVVINGDKLSFIKGELYSLRRRCLTEIAALDLFGRGWKMSKWAKVKTLVGEVFICVSAGRFPSSTAVTGWFQVPPHYLGSTTEKRLTLSQYKYSLVIENSLEFLTEKLFDCFFAGTIPIYVGPNVEDFNIPSNLVIQVQPTVGAICDGIAKAKNVDYGQWQDALKKWLSQAETQMSWSAEAVFERIAGNLTSSDAKPQCQPSD